ncbi:MAG: zinc transporter ZntB [Rhodospirillales bacterium]|nr:zinc transporter ZntB [Rhodospirillales bacterium]
MTHEAVETAWILEPDGKAVHLRTDQVGASMTDPRPTWLLLNRTAPGLEDWLMDNAIVRPELIKPLLMEDTRPRCDQFKEGVLLNLRGVNLNPGAAPEDMLSLRMWITDRVIVSLHRQPIMAINDIIDSLNNGEGPEGIGHFLTMVAENITERLDPVVQDLEDQLDQLEDLLDAADARTNHRALLDQLADIRPAVTTLRRFIAPQQIALLKLSTLQVTWLDELDRISLHHTVDQVTRIVEDLDALRERATITKDAIQQNMSNAMTQSMSRLAAMTVVFLPLGFFTGLFGINVGGIPGVGHPWAFTIVFASLVALGLALWAVLHAKRLL